MTASLFWPAAVGMTVMAWLLVVVPATRRRRGAARPASPEASNLLVLRDALQTLNAEFSTGRIDASEHARSRRDIEGLAYEEAAVPASLHASTPPSRTTSMWLGLGIAAFAFCIYGYLGNRAALEPQPFADLQVDAQAAEDRAAESLLDGMVQQMQAQRAGTVDAAGWALVARSYAAMSRFEKASPAFERALALSPQDADLLVDQADVLAMLQGLSTRGEPARLIARALQIAPRHPKALALAGSDAFERRDFPDAIDYWTQAREAMPTGAFAAGMDAQLQLARAAMGSAPAASPAPAPGDSSIRGTVTVSADMMARIQPSDTVFVFARAPNSSGMPLAIARYRASELPIRFTLDESSAMGGAQRLSSSSPVVVVARVSRSGDAMPHPDDLYGESTPTATGVSNVDIVIGSPRR